jgi:tRNA (guanine37-N1)-methyltransferase
VRFDVITLFPELLTPFTSAGINRRAFETGAVELKLWQLRDYAEGTYRRVDDRPFGGGPGMVMSADPLEKCLLAIRQDRLAKNPSEAPVPVVLFSPIGQTLTHSGVESWSQSDGAILICGRYEGLDQRFIETYVNVQISLGDFVLSGGEIAAIALLDAVARLQPGVLNDEGSHQMDSFNPAIDGLLDCGHYTRPETWHGQSVPPILMSGHHADIAKWRRQQSLSLTHQHRPDLLVAARAKGQLSVKDEHFLAQLSDHDEGKAQCGN